MVDSGLGCHCASIKHGPVSGPLVLSYTVVHADIPHIMSAQTGSYSFMLRCSVDDSRQAHALRRALMQHQEYIKPSQVCDVCLFVRLYVFIHAIHVHHKLIS